ncbi:hypothetical protein QTO01_10295 [Vibrio mytili]|uniref:Uncharacterized protein n=1 Tax=Vibrio mytili TaxID=50718 RepID=A0A0C3DDE1_9VIBR|nr:hypothetical protein [Vibrio mytili]KIN09379.1 hypothetical protein SU60_20260 [Vibrio mytili]
MINSSDFLLSDGTLRFKNDEYPLSKVKGVRVKTNTLKDHVLRVIVVGFIVSSIVWVICPDGFGQLTAPLSLLLGAIAGGVSAKKYELQIEFQHSDETGLQWISVAKSSKQAGFKVFENQAKEIGVKII